MNPLAQRLVAPLVGAAAASGDGPWRAKTVLLALLIVLAGLGFWVRDIAKGSAPPAPAHTTAPVGQSVSGGAWDFSRPFPGHVRFCASYVGGFFIGWAFRRFIRFTLALAALAALLVGLGKYTGCNLAPAESEVTESAGWAKHEAIAGEHYLKHLLPSATAGCVGAFLGFRRKDKPIAPASTQPSAA